MQKSVAFAVRDVREIALLVLVLVLPFNIVYHFDSSNAFLDGRYVNYLDFVVHIIDIAVLGVIGTWLWKENIWRKRKFKIVCAILSVFLCAETLIFEDAVARYNTLRLSLYIMGLAILSFSLTSSKKPLSEKFMKVLFGILSLLSVLQSAIGILQFFKGKSVGILRLGESVVNVVNASSSSVFLFDGYHLRAYGTFPHPNVLGGFLVVSLFLLLVLSEGIRGKFRYSIIPSIAIITAGIFFTWSRTAWALSIVLLASWCIRWIRANYPHYLRKVLVICSIFVGIFVIWILRGTGPFPESIRGRLIGQSASSDMSVIERRELSKRALDLFKSNPLWGVGPGRFIIESSADPVYTERGIRVMQPAHNVFLLAVSEIGIFGTGLLLFIFILLVEQFRPSYPLLMSFLIILGIGLMDHYLWTLPQGMSLIFLLVFVSAQSSFDMA